MPLTRRDFFKGAASALGLAALKSFPFLQRLTGRIPVQLGRGSLVLFDNFGIQAGRVVQRMAEMEAAARKTADSFNRFSQAVSQQSPELIYDLGHATWPTVSDRMTELMAPPTQLTRHEAFRIAVMEQAEAVL
jgi:hypothetical protein